MRKKMLHKAKLVIKIESNRKAEGPIKIKVLSIFDNRIQKMWTEEHIAERGLSHGFMDLDDMKETLNWNLHGDSSKYQFGWDETVNGISKGTAYVFE